MTLPPDYNERVYAGWLGKCIGVRFGAPLENWTYEDIRDNLGELTTYLREDAGKIFKPDDDTAVPMILIHALDGLQPGKPLTPQRVAEALLNGIGDGHGTFWWGGYGVSTEHTAYMNLAAGIPAPRSGSIAQNGAALAEQIGGQIFSDIWGLVAPNDPARAADMAAAAASVTHDGEGIYGGRFIAALVSAAFSERDPRRLIETALAQIPADSEYARVVNAMCDFHATTPDDWRAAFAYLKANFGYDRYPGVVHIIPNTGVVAIGLLYSGGDFSRAIQITNMCGWDTDCNVGNVGAVMGVAVGLDGIDQSWRAPMNDLLITAGVIGTRTILTIPQCADLFVRYGRQLANAAQDDAPVRYHFRYPGSTSNFEAKGTLARPIHQRQAVVDGRPVLQTAVRKLNKKGEVRAFTRTYYRPKELSGNYYGACFTPLVFPGQQVTTTIYIPPDAPESLTAALYVYDDNHGVSHQATGTPLVPGQWQTLDYTIPPLTDACLSQVGVVVRNLGEVWETGSFCIESLAWQGAPEFTTTFAKERAETGGISQWTRVRGYWRIEDGAYHGSGVGLCETYTGDLQWTAYTVEADVTPLMGEHHLVMARVQGASHGYAFGLAPGGRLAVYHKDTTPVLVTETPFAWRHGERYTLRVVADGDVLTCSVTGADGASASLTVQDVAYQSGQIGLATWHGGHMAVHGVRVRPVASEG